VSGYWLDIGTPERYLQATFEILEGEVRTEIGQQVAEAGGVLLEGERSGIAGAVHAPAFVGPGCELAADAIVGARSVLGRGVQARGRSARGSSVVLDGTAVGAGARISGSIVGTGVTIGDRCRVQGQVMLGEGVWVGAGNILAAGMTSLFRGAAYPTPRSRFDGRRPAQRRGDRLHRLHRQVARHPWVCPSICATRCGRVESAGNRPRGHFRRLVVAGMAAQRLEDLAPRRRSGTGVPADRGHARLCPAGVDHAGYDGAVLQLLG